jgi:hypothetical protein
MIRRLLSVVALALLIGMFGAAPSRRTPIAFMLRQDRAV